MASFRKRGNKWEYRVSHSKDGKREFISKGGFNTKTEAKVEAEKIEYQLNIGLNVSAGEMLFVDYYKNWVETYKMGAYSIETDKFYEQAITVVEDYFSGVKLKSITRESYQRFLNDFSKGRAKATVRKAHTKVGAALIDAFHNGDISINPAYKPTIRGGAGVKSSDKFLHEEEVKAVMNELLSGIRLDYMSRYMLILQFATGMRISEVMAITFKDLDFLNNTVMIDKSWDYKFTRDFKPTKNHESRKVSVDKKTMQIIKELYDHQINKKVLDNKQRLFEMKGKIPSVNAVNKTLRRACKRAGVQEVTSHALRHTHASILLLNDVNVAYISKRLGHRDMSITMDVYAHVLDEMQEKSGQASVEILQEIYND